MPQFLSDAERVAAAARSPAALKRVARAVVPRAADFCLIFLRNGQHVRCVAAAHATVEGQRLLRSFVRLYPISLGDPVSTVAHVVRTGRPHVRATIRADIRPLERPAPVLALLDRLAPRSALVVPIGAPPHVRGAVSLAYAASGRRYTPEDVPAAMRLARLFERLVVRDERGATSDAAASSRRRLRLRARA
jgi:GAF domain-containing protein